MSTLRIYCHFHSLNFHGLGIANERFVIVLLEPLAGERERLAGNVRAALCDDCDDASSATYPGNREVCDRVDNDCSSGGGALAGGTGLEAAVVFTAFS